MKIRRVALRKILEVVADTWGVPVGEIIGRSRDVHYTEPRFAVMLLAREEDYSLMTIGKFLGGRDHGAVIHGVRRAKDMCEVDPNYAPVLEAARAKIVNARNCGDGTEDKQPKLPATFRYKDSTGTWHTVSGDIEGVIANMRRNFGEHFLAAAR